MKYGKNMIESSVYILDSRKNTIVLNFRHSKDIFFDE